MKEDYQFISVCVLTSRTLTVVGQEYTDCITVQSSNPTQKKLTVIRTCVYLFDCRTNRSYLPF